MISQVIQGSFPHGLPTHLFHPPPHVAVQPQMPQPSQAGFPGLSPQQQQIQAHQLALAAHQAAIQQQRNPRVVAPSTHQHPLVNATGPMQEGPAFSPQQRQIQAHQLALAAHQAAVQRQKPPRSHIAQHHVAQPKSAGPYATPPLAHHQRMAQPNVAQSRTMPHPSRHHASPGPGQSPAIQPHGNGSAFQLPANRSNFGRGSGQPLPAQVQEKMESFFGTNFGDVRIHVGPQASSIGALAFTHGSNIYFAPGQYNPSTPHGQQLLGHELTHVTQQRAGRVRNPSGTGVAVVQDQAMELEADRMGHQASVHLTNVQTRLISPRQLKAIGVNPMTHRTVQCNAVKVTEEERGGKQKFKKEATNFRKALDGYNTLVRRCRKTNEYNGMVAGDLKLAFDSNLGEASKFKWFSVNAPYDFKKIGTDSEHEGGTVVYQVTPELRKWLKKYVVSATNGAIKHRKKLINTSNPRVKKEAEQLTLGIPKDTFMEFWRLVKVMSDVEETQEKEVVLSDSE